MEQSGRHLWCNTRRARHLPSSTPSWSFRDYSCLIWATISQVIHSTYRRITSNRVQSEGDRKVVPDISADTLRKMASISPRAASVGGDFRTNVICPAVSSRIPRREQPVELLPWRRTDHQGGHCCGCQSDGKTLEFVKSRRKEVFL